MIAKHFEELRAVLDKAEGLPEATRKELLGIAERLEREALEPASASPPTDAGPEDKPSGTHSLISAIEGLEASHPELTAAVNNTAAMLARLGF